MSEFNKVDTSQNEITGRTKWDFFNQVWGDSLQINF